MKKVFRAPRKFHCRSETFQKDVVPCHIGFEFVQIDYIKDWPGNLPDLKLLKNLWVIMKRQLCDCNMFSVTKLEVAFKDIWNNFDPILLQNLTLSVPLWFKTSCLRKNYLQSTRQVCSVINYCNEEWCHAVCYTLIPLVHCIYTKTHTSQIKLEHKH